MLAKKYERAKDPTLLAGAVTKQEQAIQSIPDDHPLETELLLNST